MSLPGMPAQPLQPGELKLEYIPGDWRVVLLGADKNPFKRHWQTIAPKASELPDLLDREPKTRAIGLLAGPLPEKDYGLVWIDVDGESIYEVVKDLANEELDKALPPTLTIKSGRPGRERRLYKVPEKSFDFFIKNKYVWNGPVEGEQLEVLWSKRQGALMGKHPKTDGYFTPEGLGFEWCQDVPKVPAWVLEAIDYQNAKRGAGGDTVRMFGPSGGSSGWAITVHFEPEAELKKARKALFESHQVAPHLVEEYDFWLTVGMALHKIDEQGLAVWEEWSQLASNYEPNGCRRKWESFNREEGGVGPGTLYMKLQEAGWKDTSPNLQHEKSHQVTDEELDALIGKIQGEPVMTFDPLEEGFPPRGGGRSVGATREDNRAAQRENHSRYKERRKERDGKAQRNPPKRDIRDMLLHYFGGNVAFSPEHQAFFEFKNGYWEKHEYEQVTTAKIIEGLDYIQDELQQLPNSWDMALVSEMEKLLKASGRIQLPEEQKGWLLFTNGALNLESREFYEHPGRKLGLVHRMEFPYEPEKGYGAIPDWLISTQLDPNFPDKDAEQAAQVLRAFLKMVLEGCYPDIRRYLEVIGPAKTGKSQFQQLCIALVGWRNNYSTDLRSLEGERFETAQLMSKKLLTFSDQDAWGGSVAKLKAATGRDPLRAEYKNIKEVFPFVFSGHVLVVGNQAMQSIDKTTGLSSRRIFINFNNQWNGPAEEQRQLIQYDSTRKKWEGPFVDELPGLVNWLLDFTESDMRRYLENPEIYCRKIRHFNREQNLNVNPIADFVDELVIYEAGSECFLGKKEEAGDGKLLLQNEDLYPAYLKRCLENGNKPVNKKRFQADFESHILNELGLKDKIITETKRFNRPVSEGPVPDYRYRANTRYTDICLRTSNPTKYLDYPSLTEFMDGLKHEE